MAEFGLKVLLALGAPLRSHYRLWSKQRSTREAINVHQTDLNH
jgi:hypothetical protein